MSDTQPSETGQPLVELTAVMARLRAECAWKAGQTHRSLARYLLEETHETLEAIDSGDSEHLREELGDLLLQVWFHAVIAAEDGAFTIDDVAADLIAKLVRRNPHVFGADPAGAATGEAGGVGRASGRGHHQRGLGGDQGRRRSSGPRSSTACPRRSPPCCSPTRSSTASPASPTPNPSVVASRTVRSGDLTVDPAEDIGERLLALVAEARDAGVDPEQALRDVVRRLA